MNLLFLPKKPRVLSFLLIVAFFTSYLNNSLAQTKPIINYWYKAKNQNYFFLKVNSPIPASYIVPTNTGGKMTTTFSPKNVTTIAGKANTNGYTNAIGTNATFNGPKGIAIDKAQNIFVADSGNNAIRKISPDGTVTTFAGSLNGLSGSADGNGTLASFNQPIGLAIDANDNLFVADKGNNLIRKITPNGDVSTYAGTGEKGASNNSDKLKASFNEPVGIAIDIGSVIYVTDRGNYLIRRIGTDGSVSTLDGTAGVSGKNDGGSLGVGVTFGQLAGLATFNTGYGSIMVADAGNNMIRITSANKTVTTIAGDFNGNPGNTNGYGRLGEVAFNSPSSLVADYPGNTIYVTDTKNHLIRAVTRSGSFQTGTYAGDGFKGITDAVGLGAEFSDPYGIAIDSLGNLIVSDCSSNLIRRIETIGYSSGTLPTGLSFNTATGEITGTPTVAGTNTVQINATNKYGVSPITLAIEVAPSNDASLSNLNTNFGLSPSTFSPTNYSYSIRVPTDSTSVTITAQANDAYASIKINDAYLNNTAKSQKFSLVVGSNVFTILVTAQDGQTQQIYTLKVIRPASTVATLSNLSVSAGAFTPTSNSNITSYTNNVPNITDVIAITPVTTNVDAKVTVNGVLVTSGLTSQPVTLNVGPNIIGITVVAQDGFTMNQYTLTVNRAPSATNILSNLVVSDGTLSPSFNSGTTIYTAYVPNRTGSITITPSVNDLNETLTLNGISTIPGIPSQPIALNIGSNIITVEVTAPNGSTKKTYTLTVNRIASTNAMLSNLSVSNGLLTPYFINGTNNYTCNVRNTNTAIRITPTLADGGASVTVNGISCVSGTLSQSIPLEVGNNKIAIAVTAQDGITQQNYNLIVNRAPSGITLLSNLAVNNGTLTPLFDSETLLYTNNVPNTTNNLVLTPTTNDSTATVIVSLNGNPMGPTKVKAGTTEETRLPPTNYTIPLNVGNNTITTVVTAQNGTDQQTYTLTANRAPSGSAVLFNLTASGEGKWSQSFDPSILNYTYMLPYTISNVILTPTLNDASATVTISGKAVNTATPTEPIVLTTGNNLITIVVTAQDRITNQTYLLLVNRAPSPIATLSNLVLGGGSLTPLFDPYQFSYTATLFSNLIDSVTFTPVATQSNETINFNNQVITNGLPTSNIAVNNGTNTYTFTVTAQDGVTKNNYTTTIKRQPVLDNLALTYGIFTQPLSSKNNTYTDSVSNLTSTIYLTSYFKDAIGTLNGVVINSGKVSSPIQLNIGKNTFTISLTSKDGTTNTTYTAIIYRPPSDVATLSSYLMSVGALSPIFNPNVFNYSTVVPYETTAITISSIASQQDAKITVNGNSVNSGSPSSGIPLALGPNTIITQVTAQDGKTNNSYTITVIRDLGKQTFKFNTIAAIGYGSKDFSPDATVSSGLDITYTSSDTSVAVILNKKIIHIKGVGKANIIARVGLDNNYYPVDSISQTLTVIKGTQTILNHEIPLFIKEKPIDLRLIIWSDLGLKVKFYVEDKAMADTANGVITPLQIGKTTLVAVADSNSYYAPQTKIFEITIEDQANDEIVVHSIVTPNGDGFNDFLLIEGLQLFKDNTIKIINRNGILVYKAVGYDNENIKFDGHSSSNQDFLPAGTYFYIIDYTNSAGAHRHKSDYITLKY